MCFAQVKGCVIAYIRHWCWCVLVTGDKYASTVRGPDIYADEDNMIELKWGPGTSYGV